jgi:hypothetical protein
VKRSERLIRNTLLVLGGLTVLHVGVSRLHALDEQATQQSERMSPESLATLRDFSAVFVEGDFEIEVQRGDFAVDFSSPNPAQGRFYATVRDNTLLLGGFQNATGSRARVSLPELKKLNAGRVPALSISGFEGASLELEAETVARVTLRNNRIRQWQIRSNRVADLQIDRASISAGKLDLAGQATLTVID